MWFPYNCLLAKRYSNEALTHTTNCTRNHKAVEAAEGGGKKRSWREGCTHKGIIVHAMALQR